MIRANTGQANAALAKTQGHLGQTARSSNKTADAMKGLAKGAAIGAAGVAAASVKMAVDFDRSMRNVNSIAGLPEKKFQSLQKSVLKLAGPTAQAPKQLADGLYDVVSSGFKAHDAMVILKSGAIAATAGMTDTATATKAVTAVLNAYHRPASDAKAVSDDLFQTVKLGVLTFEELASSVGDVLPFAASLGVNLKGVGAAVTTMTKAGINAPETMTRIKNVMVAMFKPSDALKEAYHKLGVAGGQELVKKMGGGTVGFQRSLEAIVNTTLKAKDLQQAYKDLGVKGFDALKQKTGGASQANAALATRLAANGVSIAKLFPNIRALGGALALTGRNTRGAEKDLKGFANTTGLTNKTFKEQAKSVGVQWQRLKAQVSVLAIQFGQKLLPSISKVIKMLSNPKLSGVEKLNRLGKMLGDGISKAIPKIADAMAKAAPKAVQAFFNAFRNSSLWGKLIIASFLIHKLGGFSAFSRVGAQSGEAMAKGAATSFGGRMKSRLFGMGKMFLGASLIAGIADGITAKDVGGLGNRIQRGLSTATFGIVPDPKTISEKIAKVQQSIQAALAKGGKTGKLPGLGAALLGGGETAKQGVALINQFKSIRARATRIFGRPISLKVGIRGVAGLQSDLKTIEVGQNRLKNHLATTTGQIAHISERNLKLMGRSMNLHSRSGRQAVEHNMRLTLGAIRDDLGAGDISASKALKSIRRSFRVHTKASKESTQTNFNLAKQAIQDMMRAGVISTKDGLAEIDRLFSQYLRRYGMSASDAGNLIHNRGTKNAGQTGSSPEVSERARGGIVKAAKGLVQFGQAGAKGRDNMPVNFGGRKIVVGSGEMGAVLNRQQQQELNARTADVGGIKGFFNTYNQPHYMAKGGTIPRQVLSGPNSPLRSGAQSGLDRDRTAAQRLLNAAKRQHDAAAGPTGGGGTKGPKGLGTYAGLQMANWVIEALGHAQGKGVHPTPTSGYRSHAHNVAQGRNYFSEHEGTQYPHGAVDFGGYHSGLAEKMSVVRATADYKYPLLAPIGFTDDGHASGTGGARGGLVDLMARGGPVKWPNHRQYTRDMMEKIWVAAGGPIHYANKMASIAWSESTWRPWATNPTDGGKGLWQITPAQPGSGDALTNARQSVAKFNDAKKMWGQPLHPWNASKSVWSMRDASPGAHGKGLSRATLAKYAPGYHGSDKGGADAGPAVAKAKALTKKQRRHLKKLAKRTKGLHLTKGVEAKLKKLSGLGDVFGEYAERASTVGGKVKGFDEAHWLQVELQTLFELRNTLIKAHNRAVKLRERATKLIGRVNKELGKLRKHPKANATMIGRLKKRVLPGLKKARSGLKTRDGELISSLTDVQGLGSSMKVMKRLPAVGELGGSIFTVQGRLKELSAPAEATDSSGTGDTAASDRASERADMLQQLLTESRLRTAVSEREFAILRNAPFAGSFATGGIAQGRTGQPMQAVVHGGEGIFTPEQMAAMGGGNFQIVVNGDITGTPRGKDAVEVYKDGRRFSAQVGNARLGGRAPLPGARG